MASYDRADWHSGGDFPKGLPEEAGGTHIGMFLAWIIINRLEGDLLRQESANSLTEVRERRKTGRDFLFEECDGKFWEDDLNDEGNAFAKSYYCGPDGKFGTYLADYEATFKNSGPSLYRVADSWENYDRLEPVITRRYVAWKRNGAQP
jgi:hypothetical protein